MDSASQEGMNDQALDPALQGVTSMQETLERFLAVADVEAVYGVPVQHGETLVIPAAEVMGGMGFGMGTGINASKPTSDDEQPDDRSTGANASGSGGGGGGWAMSRPVAVIIVEPNSVRVEPVVDVTKIALAAFTAFGFMFSMFARMRTRR